MKITINQLRQIIAEEVNNKQLLNEVYAGALETLGNALRDFAYAALESGIPEDQICEIIRNEAEGTCDMIRGKV